MLLGEFSRLLGVQLSVDFVMLWKPDIVHGPGDTGVGKTDDTNSSVVSYSLLKQEGADGSQYP